MARKPIDTDNQAATWLTTATPAHLSLHPGYDLLTVIAFGAVWDGQPPEQTLTLAEDERIGFLLDEPDGDTVIGFSVDEPHDVDPFEIGAVELWDGPRFTVPVLGLADASVGEILLAVQGRFDRSEPTNDVVNSSAAIAAKEESGPAAAEPYWRLCLEAGDMKGHFGLGYTLCDVGRPREGYDHLRVYTELTPHNAWAWCWLGRAAQDMGDPAEAAAAYRRAIELEEAGGFETDAAELLEALEG